MESIIIGIFSSGFLFFVGKYFLNKKDLKNKTIENEVLKESLETQEKVHFQDIKNIKTQGEIDKNVGLNLKSSSEKKESVRDKVENTPDGESYKL